MIPTGRRKNPGVEAEHSISFSFFDRKIFQHRNHDLDSLTLMPVLNAVDFRSSGHFCDSRRGQSLHWGRWSVFGQGLQLEKNY